jgi:hypothetical protein
MEAFLRANSKSAINAYIKSTQPGTVRVFFNNELHNNLANPSTSYTNAQLANLLSDGFDTGHTPAPPRPAIKQFMESQHSEIMQIIKDHYRPYMGSKFRVWASTQKANARIQADVMGERIAETVKDLFFNFVRFYGVHPDNTPWTRRHKINKGFPAWWNSGSLMTEGLECEFKPSIPKRIRGNYFGQS